MDNYQDFTVTVLLFNEEGKILSVSRKDDHTKFGLIGGKVDEIDNSLEDAAIRECYEETSLSITNLRKVFTYMNENSGRTGTTFMAEYTGIIGLELSPKETGIIKWLTFEELKSGPFGKYNEALELHLKSNNII